MSVTPPLGAEQPDGGHTCTYGPDGALCGAQAAWHLIWTPDGENGLACEEHAAVAQSLFAVYDRHPFGGVCVMPGSYVVWSWQEPPGLCKWAIDDEALVEAANAPIKEHAHAS